MTGRGDPALGEALAMRRSGAALVDILAAVSLPPNELIPELRAIDADPDRVAKEEVSVVSGLLEVGEAPWQLYLAGFSLSSIASAAGETVERVRREITEFVDLDNADAVDRAAPSSGGFDSASESDYGSGSDTSV